MQTWYIAVRYNKVQYNTMLGMQKLYHGHNHARARMGVCHNVSGAIKNKFIAKYKNMPIV